MSNCLQSRLQKIFHLQNMQKKPLGNNYFLCYVVSLNNQMNNRAPFCEEDINSTSVHEGSPKILSFGVRVSEQKGRQIIELEMTGTRRNQCI